MYLLKVSLMFVNNCINSPAHYYSQVRLFTLSLNPIYLNQMGFKVL